MPSGCSYSEMSSCSAIWYHGRLSGDRFTMLSHILIKGLLAFSGCMVDPSLAMLISCVYQTSSPAASLSWGSRCHSMAMPLLGLMHGSCSVSTTVLLDKRRFAAFRQKRAELTLSLFCALPYLWGFGKRQYRRWADGHCKIKVDNDGLIRHTVT